MPAPAKPDVLEQISVLMDKLAADMPPGTAWTFAVVAQVPGDKLASMLCTNQGSDEQAEAVFQQAMSASDLPDTVEEHRLGGAGRLQ